MSLEELPDEILRNIITNSDFTGWMSSLMTSTHIRRVARTIPPSIFTYDRAKERIHYISESVQEEWCQCEVEDYLQLLLTRKQVQTVASRVVRYGHDGVVYLFNRDSSMQLIELHGGAEGLAMRIAQEDIKLIQRYKQRIQAVAQEIEEARHDADRRIWERRKQAFEERMEKVRAIPSPQHNHRDKDLLLTHAHVHAHKQIVFALFLCTEAGCNSSKATSRYC